MPTAAWFQIVIFISFCEINFLKQDPNKEPGDVVPEGIPWARYPDGYDVYLGDGSTKQVGKDELILGRTWKLNAERNNGRAAMMGIHRSLIDWRGGGMQTGQTCFLVSLNLSDI